VSFQAPAFLLALLLVPLAALAYGAAQRRRRAAVDAFAAPAVRASALPRRPGWRRHAPIALYGIALAALAVALARPEVTIALPSEQATIVLATDHSGSMQATDVAPNRLAAVKSAAERFLERVPDRVKVGGVAFDHRAEVLEAPGTDRAPLRAAVRDLRPSGGTATGEALAASLDLVRRGATEGEQPPAAIVLISDGESTHGRDPLPVAREAADLGIPIYTVALGTPDGTVVGSDGVSRPVPPDPETLQAIAEASGGRSYAVEDADRLEAVYERLGSQVATEKEPREVTAAFAGGALALVAGGALLSLHWFRRLV
jgi:Ca-activated chloride channel homolog